MSNQRPRLSLRLLLPAVAISIIACSESAPPGPPNPLEPPTPAEGVQIKMVSVLSPGQEIERCLFYKAPAQGLAVTREIVRYTPGSHHVLLYSTPYKEIPNKTRDGRTVDTSGVFDCPQGATGDWEVSGGIGGAQNSNGDPIIDGLPADTAFVVPGGTVLLMNTHYLNASPSALTTDARINLYTMPMANVRQEAGILFFYNPFIQVPPYGMSVARESCELRAPITLLNAQSHMHRRGANYVASLTEPTGEPMMELFSTTEWSEVALRKFDPPLVIPAGKRVDFRCEYNNTEGREVFQGPKTTDEMCMFMGLYYPKHDSTQICSAPDSPQVPFLGAKWIGNGTQTCAQTVNCALAAGGVPKLYGCVVKSCPKVATPMSDLIRCVITKGFLQLQTGCKAEYDACQAATCN